MAAKLVWNAGTTQADRDRITAALNAAQARFRLPDGTYRKSQMLRDGAYQRALADFNAHAHYEHSESFLDKVGTGFIIATGAAVTGGAALSIAGGGLAGGSLGSLGSTIAEGAQAAAGVVSQGATLAASVGVPGASTIAGAAGAVSALGPQVSNLFKAGSNVSLSDLLKTNGTGGLPEFLKSAAGTIEDAESAWNRIFGGGETQGPAPAPMQGPPTAATSFLSGALPIIVIGVIVAVAFGSRR